MHHILKPRSLQIFRHPIYIIPETKLAISFQNSSLLCLLLESFFNVSLSLIYSAFTLVCDVHDIWRKENAWQ